MKKKYMKADLSIIYCCQDIVATSGYSIDNLYFHDNELPITVIS